MAAGAIRDLNARGTDSTTPVRRVLPTSLVIRESTAPPRDEHRGPVVIGE